MYLRPLLAFLVLFKLMCMVNMGNSSSTRVPRDEVYYNDNVSDVSIACIKSHLKSGRPAKEFMILENEEPGCDDTITEAQKVCNKEKNRYVNILPCDSTRVRLTPIAGVDGSDYINANFIDGELNGTERAYIATQGPLMHTRGDFWRMVWENNSTIVVMLGKEKENDRVKVDRYWPDEGEPPLHFHNIQVELVAKEYDPELSIAVRKLNITYDPYNKENKKETRQVLHYQYEGWPDHGVPPSAAPIRHLVRIIERERSQDPIPRPSPMVVHCSAGVGRTGTFVTIHMTLLRLFHELKNTGLHFPNNPLNNSFNNIPTLNNSHNNLNISHNNINTSTSNINNSNSNSNGNNINNSNNNISPYNNPPLTPKSSASPNNINNVLPTARFNLYNTVLKLRRQRPGMVQQQEQYVFCYEAVAEEAEQLGLLPPSPGITSHSPRLLSVSTSSLPSPSTSSNHLRTSSSSYISTPTSVPASPNFLQLSSSGVYTPNFLNSSSNSLPSPPPSPYLHATSLDCSTNALFPPPHEQPLTPPVDCHK